MILQQRCLHEVTFAVCNKAARDVCQEVRRISVVRVVELEWTTDEKLRRAINWTKIDHTTFGQQQQRVEQLKDLCCRLMNCGHYSAVLIHELAECCQQHRRL